VTRQAEQMGVAPDQLAQQLVDNGQLSFAAAEVLRGKAMNLIAERVKVTDPSGQEVDIKSALNAPLLAAEDDAADYDDDEAEIAADDDDAEVIAATETGAAEASAAQDDTTEA
jgi:trigger factor